MADGTVLSEEERDSAYTDSCTEYHIWWLRRVAGEPLRRLPWARPRELVGEVVQHPRWTPYRIVRVLGRGGGGVVFEAEECHDPQVPLGDCPKRFALKLPNIWSTKADAKDTIDLLKWEIRSIPTEKKPHFHIVRHINHGAWEVPWKKPPADEEEARQRLKTLPFLVLELLEGDDLVGSATPDRPLPLKQAITVLGEMTEALSWIHGEGRVHLDLHPGNVFLARMAGERERRVKILDWGMAWSLQAMRRDAGFGGVPGYVPPEPPQDDLPSLVLRDIYSAGAVFFFAVTGRKPEQHNGASWWSHMKRQVAEALRSQDDQVHPVCDFLAHAMALDPANRIVDSTMLKREVDKLKRLCVQHREASADDDWADYLVEGFGKLNPTVTTRIGLLFDAVRLSTGAPCVLHVLRDGLARDRSVCLHFDGMARRLLHGPTGPTLSHPYIARVVWHGKTREAEPRPCCARGQLGATLEELWSNRREASATSLRRWLGLLGGVAGAIDYLHDEGIVHRGISPGVIASVGPQRAGRLVIADLSVARRKRVPLPNHPRFFRRSEYTDPADPKGEQPACDIYAFGCLVHLLIFGRPPGPGPLPAEVPDSCPPQVWDALRRATSENPRDRPGRARPWLEAIEACFQGRKSPCP